MGTFGLKRTPLGSRRNNTHYWVPFQMELNEKIKLIRKKHKFTQAEFAEMLDIPPSTYKKNELGQREMSVSKLLKVIEKYPEYALWLTTEEVAPEAGQIAPGENGPKMGHSGVPAELLNSAFERTMDASISLGWLSPKEGIKFSMLADLFRHDFVEVGGVLIEPVEGADESQAG